MYIPEETLGKKKSHPEPSLWTSATYLEWDIRVSPIDDCTQKDLLSGQNR